MYSSVHIYLFIYESIFVSMHVYSLIHLLIVNVTTKRRGLLGEVRPVEARAKEQSFKTREAAKGKVGT